MKSLYERLREHVFAECDRRLKGVSCTQLVVFAGNGMTRIAAAMTKDAADPSWHKWIANCLEDVDAKQDLEYLISLNYSFDQIFSFLIWSAGDKHRQMWKRLWDVTWSVDPSPLHHLVVQLAHSIITTNYDTLFEIASEREGLAWNRFNLLAENPKMPDKGASVIWKLHGTFPDRSEANTTRNEDNFNTWYHNGGADETVASSTKYQKWALDENHDSFVSRFGSLIEVLRDKGNLVVFFGLGLGAEELIITRLLSVAAGDRAIENWVALEVPEDLDPLYRLKRRKIVPISVPLGLGGGSMKRALAMVALLEWYASKYGPSNKRDELLKKVGACLADKKFPPSAREISLGTSSPLVISIGQSSINKMIGIERGVSQEAAYAAKKSSWVPGNEDKRRVLVSYEVGGQALIPTLIWDALRIPCGLISEVYSDDFGRRILHRLQDAEWVDFTGVKQNQLPKGVNFGWQTPATENATVATWFGVRTLLDAADSGRPGLKIDSALFDLTPGVIYVTKRGWEGVRDALNAKPGYNPLIVFETGGIGNLEAEVWAASRRGIVIASAVAHLRWENSRVTASLRSGSNDLQSIQEARKQAVEDWEKKEAKDDRGRLVQTNEVLERLTPGETPLFLDTILSGLHLYAVTLGELGMIYWVKDGGDWIGPKWCTAIEATEGADTIEGPIPNRDVRNGTECGDASRAGFVASLILLSPDPYNLWGIVQSPHHLQRAVEWGNWFGACKMQFFSLYDYIDFLKLRATDILKAISLVRPPCLGGSGDFCDLNFRTEPAVANGKLCDGLEKWQARTKALRNPRNRELWEMRVREWAEARGFK